MNESDKKILAQFSRIYEHISVAESKKIVQEIFGRQTVRVSPSIQENFNGLSSILRQPGSSDKATSSEEKKIPEEQKN